MNLASSFDRELRSCLRTTCEDSSCSLNLDSFPVSSLRIVDGDKYQKVYSFAEKLCDCIVFHAGRNRFVAAVELKGGRIRAREALDQLSNGARVARDIIQSYLPHMTGSNVPFLPVLLHGKRIQSEEFKLLLRRRIRFWGRDFRVIIGRCGAYLRDIIQKHR